MSNRSRVLARVGLAAAGFITVAVASTGPASAGTAPTDGLGAIDVIIHSPPVLETELDFRLLLDGTDVRTERCRDAEISSVTEGQVFRCDGLVDGAYTLELAGLPGGWYGAPWECAEPIGYSLFAPQPTIGSGPDELDHWGCNVAATPPAIAAEFQPVDLVPETGDGFGYAFIGADGEEVPALCGPSLDFSGPTTCHIVELGSYTMRIDGVPDGYRTRTECSPGWEWLPSGQVVEPTVGADVTATWPFWVCYGSAWAPIVIESFAGATVTISGPGGPIEGACTPLDDGATWNCLGLDDGTYHLEARSDGSPLGVTCVVVDESEPSAPFYIDDPSGDVTVAGTEPEQCRVSSSPPEVVTTTAAPADDELPPTGDADGALAATAGMLVLLGAGLLLAARRRAI